jgi:elongation factor Ts
MPNYTAADVKKLRDLTAAGMMDCKNALVDADGDFDKAVEIIRVKGQRGVTKREGRATSNGAIVAKVDGTDAGVLLELACETDFVAKSHRFIELADQVVTHVFETSPADVPALLASEIAAGQTVQQLVDEANAALGEKIEVRRFAQLGDGHVAVYLHRTSPDLPQVGVLVEFDAISGDDSARTANEVAQHIAAFSPRYLSRDDVPADTVAEERRIAEATAREEGKPEQALSKIVEGRVTGFFKENVLLDQSFARDNKKTVATVLKESGMTLKRFARYRVGTE